jgi:small GTP-binding protein
MSAKNKAQPSAIGNGDEAELPPAVKLLHTFEGQRNEVYSLAFHPQGRMLASGSSDETLKLWDAQSGELLHTLEGHLGPVYSLAFDPQGRMLASGSSDETIKLWDAHSGKLLRTLEGHLGDVYSLVFHPQARMLASGSSDKTLKLWVAHSGELLHTLEGHQEAVNSLAFHPQGRMLASGSSDETLKLWDAQSGELLHTLEGHQGPVYSLAFDPQGRMLASGSSDKTLKLWDAHSGKLLRTLEGHTNIVDIVSFSPDGRLLASKSNDKTVRLWNCETWETIAIIPMPKPDHWIPALAFHPTLPQLAVTGYEPDTPDDQVSSQIQLWELVDYDMLLGQRTTPLVSYTSAKVVLVGDSGVGKTGLGWRLAHGEFKEHASTHGQQFWLLDQLCQQRGDGTQCEAVLWDLAGQPDYRLIHALFLDDADLALVLFDPTRDGDPLSGVEFWLRQLKVGAAGKTPTLLIAARSDRGMPRLMQEDLDTFCKQRGIVAYLPTSAREGEGIDQLIQRMQGLIDWDGKPPTTTTDTFKRTKDLVLGLKENRHRQKMVLTPKELRKQLEKTDRKWQFTDAEMLTAVGHLENHGYVTRLKTSRGKPRILLAPELLNNLAASFVLEARRNVKGLGALEEKNLLSGGYKFPELEKLSEAERDILLDSAAVLFLEHNVCFRETDPLNTHTYLVFPELINLKRPLEDDGKPVEDGVAYTVVGAVENVYASLVVLMGYTQTFTRTNQWQNHSRYEVGNGQVCGFRLEEDRGGELDFVLYFGVDTSAPVRMLFQSLFENFLARRNLTVRRLEPVHCLNGHPIDRIVVRRISARSDFTFCSECGEKTSLPKGDQPIQLTRMQAAEVEANRRAADERSRFEQVLFRLKTYMTEQKLTAPECFISYAWGNSEHEHWVEKRLATDLQKAGIGVVLDRWHNSQIGASVARFVERIEKSDRIVMVGTTLYRHKYDNKDTSTGYVVAAEVDLIANRLLGTEAQKESVLPLLLEGEKTASLPPLMHGRVYADFRDKTTYFNTVFDLILSLYHLPPNHSAVADQRDSLRGSGDDIVLMPRTYSNKS